MADANLTVLSRAGAMATAVEGPAPHAAGQASGESGPSDFRRLLSAGSPAAEADPTVPGSDHDLAADTKSGLDADDQDATRMSDPVDPASTLDPTQIDALLGMAGDGNRAGITPQSLVPVAVPLPLAGLVTPQAAVPGSGTTDPSTAVPSDAGASVHAAAQRALGICALSTSQITADNAVTAPVNADSGDATLAATNSGAALLYQGMVEQLEGSGTRTGSRANAARGLAAGAAASQGTDLASQPAGDPAPVATLQAAASQDPRSLAGSTLDAAVVAALRVAGERAPDAGSVASDAGGSNVGAVGSSSLSVLDTAGVHRGGAPQESAGAASLAPAVTGPVGSLAWRDQIAGRVSWMIDNGEQQASLRLAPENLGPLEVRIAVREGEASVWFGASQPETRAALEQAMPRLREMLAGSGLSLTNSGVFSDSPRDPWRALASAGMARAASESGLGDLRVDATPVRVIRGLLDLYA